MITVTNWEKSEWTRLATAAYAQGVNAIGHRYSAAAALPNGTRLDCATYDRLQGPYRQWLVFNIMPAI